MSIGYPTRWRMVLFQTGCSFVTIAITESVYYQTTCSWEPLPTISVICMPRGAITMGAVDRLTVCMGTRLPMVIRGGSEREAGCRGYAESVAGWRRKRTITCTLMSAEQRRATGHRRKEVPNSMVLNGNKTRGTCGCCQTPGILIEHGYEERGIEYSLHLNHCPVCGDEIFIVGYDCPDCKEPLPEDRAQAARHAPRLPGME